MTPAIANAMAASVPGRTRSQQSALTANPIRRRSTTISLAPRALASATFVAAASREVLGLCPHKQYTAGPLVIRCADRGSGREGACIISVPSAEFGPLQLFGERKAKDRVRLQRAARPRLPLHNRSGNQPWS